MLELKLAFRNIKNGGLKTWLNVAILSFIYVLIIGSQGIYDGMLEEGSQAMIKDEIGAGQYWHQNYDPFDPLSYEDAHGKIPERLSELIKDGKAEPILIRQASIYPDGRIQTVLLRGIDPGQAVLGIPTASLDTKEDYLPVLIGRVMAKKTSLKEGDYITIRWRDANGTFDAAEGKIAKIMRTKVATIDSGQLWLPLEKLQEMTTLEGEATMVVIDNSIEGKNNISGWKFKDQAYLMRDLIAMVKSKRVSSWIMYSILILLAVLAIFDTQILSIFKRRKEIGTLVALGMTRWQVVTLFTLEGAMYGILAVLAAALWGTPLIILFAKTGMPLPEVIGEYGFAMADRLFPVYTAGLVLTTIVIVMVTVTIVSFLPSSKISKMNPTDALKGKVS